MSYFEETTHTFIVRIWHEPREIKGATPEWRGMIENMQDHERMYFQSLAEVTAFITPYLEQKAGRRRSLDH